MSFFPTKVSSLINRISRAQRTTIIVYHIRFIIILNIPGFQSEIKWLQNLVLINHNYQLHG